MDSDKLWTMSLKISSCLSWLSSSDSFIDSTDYFKIVLTFGLDLLVGEVTSNTCLIGCPASSSNSSCTPSMNVSSSMLSTTDLVKRCSLRTSRALTESDGWSCRLLLWNELVKAAAKDGPVRKGHDWPSSLHWAQRCRPNFSHCSAPAPRVQWVRLEQSSCWPWDLPYLTLVNWLMSSSPCQKEGLAFLFLTPPVSFSIRNVSEVEFQFTAPSRNLVRGSEAL